MCSPAPRAGRTSRRYGRRRSGRDAVGRVGHFRLMPARQLLPPLLRPPVGPDTVNQAVASFSASRDRSSPTARPRSLHARSCVSPFGRVQHQPPAMVRGVTGFRGSDRRSACAAREDGSPLTSAHVQAAGCSVPHPELSRLRNSRSRLTVQIAGDDQRRSYCPQRPLRRLARRCRVAAA